MVKWLSEKLFGTKSERDLKKLTPYVGLINDFESRIRELSDDALRAKTGEFREKLAQGAALDDLLPEAFAVVREAARRTTGMRPFDVQLIGGVVLHQGKIAEMKTGEGKTLVSTLPAYLNALEGRGVHIVTVNDYLAKRDTEWMGPIHRFLGLTVGTIQHDMPDADRLAAYRADITYGTNNEFGFDYLRDNMKFRLSDLVQRPFNYAVVDEVDSILIDEARTPLIISGPSEGSTDLYQKADTVVRRFAADTHFKIDEKSRAVSLLEEGVAAAEKALHVSNLYDLSQMDLVHGLNQALKAHFLFKRDVDYMVKDGQVIIVDEFTGRLMPGRRYSDGLHQALEAKERVRIEQENQTLASITFQNYFRMYKKLAGMTGTAATEAEEFRHIYGLDVVEIPTNKPLIRIENPDVIYRTAEEKWNAVQEEIVALNATGRPVLVGTTSIEKSELLSGKLRRKGIKHVVLNAKYHEQEAGIIAQAGRSGAVTIATNMAGRGVDILLGGNPEAIARETLRRAGVDPAKAEAEQLENARAEARKTIGEEHDRIVGLGGLHILGTERHEARRIDNQLRGRAGRQGDPGSSRFYLSLEDDLMRIFGSDRIKGLMARIGMAEGVPIEHSMVSKAIQRAQKQVEGHNFTIRKHLLEYDDVMNKQRMTVYAQRKDILEGKDLKSYIEDLVEQILDWQLDTYVSENKSPDEWDLDGFRNALASQFGIDAGGLGIDWNAVSFDPLREKILVHLRKIYEDKERLMGAGMMRQFERFILLQIIDNQWKDHLLGMDYLKEGIGLRGYGQRDPLVEYKKESFEMFQDMLDRIEDETVRYLYLLQPAVETEMTRRPERAAYRQGPPPGGGGPKTAARAMIPRKRKR
ncbi:MAG TPA: preprotein translocase subunit SecA [Candidatus Aminicenantes bacterium]|nr:preprotein translocase subunit SecA [Candidatus Aminicenantes bacterium]HOS11184.1 preprotein translocase subunit SecA [Candidatus Aminicenantes bacterium]HPL12600.1 preprotein translocase subunit SecA [Candidatus Aminicenantes bacterium]HQF97496.1 preprotein translocase subunit SecA [Candidatus Aminicenantes bacterium]